MSELHVAPYPDPPDAGRGLSLGRAVSTSRNVSSLGRSTAAFLSLGKISRDIISFQGAEVDVGVDLERLPAMLRAQPMQAILDLAASHTGIWWTALLVSKPINLTTPSLHPTARN